MSELDIIVDESSVSNIDEDVVSLEERANRIRQLTADVTRGFIDIGFELIAAKKEIGHGNWTEWLKSEFNWSIRTAQNFMALAERFGNTKTFSLLPTSTLIKMLALPEGDEEKFVEKQVENGRPIETQSAREIQKSIKEWNQNKASKAPVVDTSSINEESSTPEPSEHNNDTVTELEFTETTTSEERTDSIAINSTEEEPTNNIDEFQVKAIRNIWNLVKKKSDLQGLEIIHFELLRLINLLEEKMNHLRNMNT